MKAFRNAAIAVFSLAVLLTVVDIYFREEATPSPRDLAEVRRVAQKISQDWGGSGESISSCRANPQKFRQKAHPSLPESCRSTGTLSHS